MRTKYRHLSFKQQTEQNEIIWQGYRKERGCRRRAQITIYPHRRKKHGTIWVAYSVFGMRVAEYREVADFLEQLNKKSKPK